MFDKIITVTLSACLDITLWVDDFYFDDPIRVQNERISAGGKGLNVSRVLNGLGENTTAICAVGEENAHDFVELAKEIGVDVVAVYCKGKVRENLTILTPDHRQIKLNRTAEVAVDELISGVRDSIMQLIKQSDKPLVHFGGSLPKGMTKTQFMDLMIEVKSMGALLSVDSAALAIDDYASLCPFLIKPNLPELSAASCINLSCKANENELIHAVKPLLGKIDHILISLGDQGIMRIDEDTCTHIKAPSVCTRTTVGAGDSAIAGYLYALKQGEVPNQALRVAAACGACACELDEASAINHETIKIMLERLERLN